MVCSIASSLTALGSVRRVPSYSSMSSASTLSAVTPARIECTPQELLPIMPPSVQRECVAGSGPNVRSCSSAASRSRSSTSPGCTRAKRRSWSSSTIALRYFEKSISTAALTVWPASPVPQPRATTSAARPVVVRDRAAGVAGVVVVAMTASSARAVAVAGGAVALRARPPADLLLDSGEHAVRAGRLARLAEHRATDREADPRAALLAAAQRVVHQLRLLGRDLRGHRRLVRGHHRLHHHRTGCV